MREYLLTTLLSTLSVMRYVFPSIFAGLFIANLLSARSFFASRGARFIPVLSRFSGLPSPCVAAVLLSIGDRTAGLALLSTSRSKENLTHTDIIAANMVMKAPSAIQPFFFAFLPIMTAMFPGAIVVKFLVLYLACFIFVTVVGIIMARRHNKLKPEIIQPLSSIPMKLPPMRESLIYSLRKTLPAFLNIGAWLLGMSFVAGILARSGFLDGLSSILPIPTNQIPYAAAGLVSIFGGIGAAGVAFGDGFLTLSELLPLLFATALLHNIYDYFASLLPLHISIYGRTLGLKTASILSLVTIACILAVMGGLSIFGY
jgi:hypothetical protein